MSEDVVYDKDEVLDMINKLQAPIRIETVGRCGASAGEFASNPAMICALPHGHAGWHKSDDGAEWNEMQGGTVSWAPRQEKSQQVARKHYAAATLLPLGLAIAAVEEVRDLTHDCGFPIDEGYMEAALALLRHAEGEMKK